MNARWVRGLAAAFAVAAAAATAPMLLPPPLPERTADVYRLRSGWFLYRFHATFRIEALFYPQGDPYETRDFSALFPADLARLRAEFLRRLRLHRLEDVPVTEGEWRKLVEGVGYLGGRGEGPR